MQNRKLPSDWLNELKSKNDIVTTISSYIPVIKKGRQYWARCPFHHEKTPSFAINNEGQYYHCFGCGESGDVITFVEKMESISTGDTIRKLAEKAGLEMPMLEDGAKIAQKKKEKDNALQALNLAKEFYIKSLYEPSAKIAQEYIKKRKFKKSDLDRFQIGYANGNGVINYLTEKGISKENMISAGIINDIDGRLYDHIYNRLAFPIINTFGDCIGFSGRILENNSEKAKYKNTAQTIVYDKSSSIYGIHLLKEAKRKGQLEQIILVEGQIDVIIMHSFGFNTTVASLGTAFTEKHADQLKRISENLVLLFDGDSAGEKAALRAIELLKPFDFNLKVARLPKEYDPDDYLRENGAEGMKKIISSAKTPIEYQLDLFKESGDLSKAEDNSSYIRKSLNLISTLATMSEREIYLKIISQNSGVPLDILRRDSSYVNEENLKKEGKEVLISAENGNIKAIKYVLLSIIRNETFAQLNFDIKKYLFNPIFKNILLCFEEIDKNNKTNETVQTELLNNLDNEEKQFIVELLEIDYSPNKDYFNQCVWKIIEVTLKMKQQVLNEEYKNSENREERLKIAQELSDIVNKLKTKNID